VPELNFHLIQTIAENSNTVSQHNIDETKEEPHADSKTYPVPSPNKDEVCKVKEDPLGDSTEGVDVEDMKVSKFNGLNVSSIWCI
jgi:hypothetical protein